jgi:hypothetical protein
LFFWNFQELRSSLPPHLPVEVFSVASVPSLSPLDCDPE